MRRLFRLDLSTETHQFFADCQQTQTPWKTARRKPAFDHALNTLKRMAGDTERCMYCLDSHGCDVEHFKPHQGDSHIAFSWLNLLLACTTCNRDFKGVKFPLDADGEPLLIDPTTEDPWLYLDFVPKTGNIEPAYDLKLDALSPKGLATTNTLGLDCRQALSNRYKRTYRRLADLIDSSFALEHDVLVNKLIEADDHGLLGWCFSPQGKRQSPFDRLTDSHWRIWLAATQALAPPTS